MTTIDLDSRSPANLTTADSTTTDPTTTDPTAGHPTAGDPAATPDAGAGAAPFADRVFQAVLGAQAIQAAYLGDRLGWYAALAEGGPSTSTQLAERTGTVERYAREWLEHQATCGWLTVDDAGAAPGDRRFTLPAEHAEVLADPESLTFLAPLAQLTVGIGRHVDALVDAYRHGGGVSWERLGADAREAQAAANRPLFLHQLTQDLLPAAPAVQARLQTASRIADVGCGAGWSTIALALAHPDVRVDGFDVDEPSLAMARANAVERGVADRVTFHRADAGGLVAPAGGPGSGSAGGRVDGYDVVFAFECLHDMPHPVEVLAGMRRLAGDDGMVVVMDERTADRFTPDAGEVEQLLYGFSITCCLPDGMAHAGSAGTGTVLRADTLRSYAAGAGYRSVEVLPVEHELFRFYRLHF